MTPPSAAFQPLDPVACATFLVVAFVAAGLCQTVWLASPASLRFGEPIDGGRTIGGRRIFGENKTWRGVVVMVPATSLAFALLAVLIGAGKPLGGVWPLSPLGYAGLGVVAGLGFMAGELPNSFVKRRLGIVPGSAASGPIGRVLCPIADRIDSVAGMLLAVSFAVRVPVETWLLVAVVGPVLHGMFSVLVFQLGGKARAA